MEEEIGKTAGAIWNALNTKGELPLSEKILVARARGVNRLLFASHENTLSPQGRPRPLFNCRGNSRYRSRTAEPQPPLIRFLRSHLVWFAFQFDEQSVRFTGPYVFARV